MPDELNEIVQYVSSSNQSFILDMKKNYETYLRQLEYFVKFEHVRIGGH